MLNVQGSNSPSNDYPRGLRPQQVDFQTTWGPLRETIVSILNLKPVTREDWNQRFHDIYKLCIAFPESHSDRIYTETRKLMEDHVKGIHDMIRKDTPAHDLLGVYNEKWLIFQQAINYLSTLFNYLNTQYVRKFRFANQDWQDENNRNTQKLMEINELGAYLWRINMIEALKDDIVKLLLASINEDRHGKPQNQSVIKSVIDSFLMVETNQRVKIKPQLYCDTFEKPFLLATQEFYTQEAKILLESSDCSTYLEKVLACLNVERQRLVKFLPTDSHPRVIEVCEKCMVGDYLVFFQNECRMMVKNEVSKDLHNMFLLLKPIEAGLKVMVDQVEDHIRERGLTVIKSLVSKDENYIQNFVEEILKVYYHFLTMIDKVFDNDKSFMSALDRACTSIINYRENTKLPCKSPEILSRYCDNILKKSAKFYTDKDMETKISEAIIIFKYISDKDIFQKFYSKMLAKRLIHSQCMSLENEESMIQKIKSVCGYEFTSKLQRMFTDVKVCDDFMNTFNAQMKTNNIVFSMSFNAYILQACAWPFPQTSVSPFNVPAIFERAINEFEAFYINKFNGRKLNWIFNVSFGEVKLMFTKKIYTVQMNTFQIAIILLFEAVDVMTYEEIQQNTNLNDEQLPRHLQSLIENKLLLVKNTTQPIEPEASTSSSAKLSDSICFNKDTKIALNLNFTSKRMKFKVHVPPQKEIQPKENDQSNGWIEEDRKMYLQAAIVRIMKTRKRLRHQMLVQEVINHAKNRFVPSMPMIKKAVDSLIEKQYIDRTESGDEYHYMA